jgi:hypothetical protein
VLLVKNDTLELQEVLVKFCTRFFFIKLQELVTTRLIRVDKRDTVREIYLFNRGFLGWGDEKGRFNACQSYLPHLQVISDDLKRGVNIHFK